MAASRAETGFPYELIFSCVSDELRSCEGAEKLLQKTTGVASSVVGLYVGSIG